MSGLLARCPDCGEKDAKCFFFGEHGEGRRICDACIGRSLAVAEDAEMDRQLHDKVQHPWPILGCERCALREVRQ